MVFGILKSFVIIVASLSAHTYAFWWSQQTTESPRSLKPVPVGYFRTYTYQPFVYPGSYSSYSYMGSHQSLAAPYLPWPQRQSPVVPSPELSLSGLNFPVQPSFSPSQTNPPAPPTPTPKYSIPHTEKIEPLIGGHTSTTQGPPHTEGPKNTNPMDIKQFSDNTGSGNIRYSPPDPLNYQYQQKGTPSAPMQQQQQVQFVPCMCPVTMTVSEVAEGRSSMDDDFEDQNGLLSAGDDMH